MGFMSGFAQGFNTSFNNQRQRSFEREEDQKRRDFAEEQRLKEQEIRKAERKEDRDNHLADRDAEWSHADTLYTRERTDKRTDEIDAEGRKEKSAKSFLDYSNTAALEQQKKLNEIEINMNTLTSDRDYRQAQARLAEKKEQNITDIMSQRGLAPTPENRKLVRQRLGNRPLVTNEDFDAIHSEFDNYDWGTVNLDSTAGLASQQTAAALGGSPAVTPPPQPTGLNSNLFKKNLLSGQVESKMGTLSPEPQAPEAGNPAAQPKLPGQEIVTTEGGTTGTVLTRRPSYLPSAKDRKTWSLPDYVTAQADLLAKGKPEAAAAFDPFINALKALDKDKAKDKASAESSNMLSYVYKDKNGKEVPTSGWVDDIQKVVDPQTGQVTLLTKNGDPVVRQRPYSKFDDDMAKQYLTQTDTDRKTYNEITQGYVESAAMIGAADQIIKANGEEVLSVGAYAKSLGDLGAKIEGTLNVLTAANNPDGTPKDPTAIVDPKLLSGLDGYLGQLKETEDQIANSGKGVYSEIQRLSVARARLDIIRIKGAYAEARSLGDGKVSNQDFQNAQAEWLPTTTPAWDAIKKQKLAFGRQKALMFKTNFEKGPLASYFLNQPDGALPPAGQLPDVDALLDADPAVGEYTKRLVRTTSETAGKMPEVAPEEQGYEIKTLKSPDGKQSAQFKVYPDGRRERIK